MISICLAEDQLLVRQGLKLMIESDNSLKVTGEAKTGLEAVELCNRQRFDLVILDIRMPEMNGLEASRIIRQSFPDIKILILTTFNDEEYALEALKNKVNGYLLKDGDSDELIRSIWDCINGGLMIEGKVAAKVMPSLLEDRKRTSVETDPCLTKRELSIMSRIAQGKNNQEISDELYLSVGTIKNHISVILNKLELRDRTQIALYAVRQNIIND